MHKAQITLKTLDYHKYRSIIISGEDDELERCSKEVRAFYEIVRTLRTRKKSFKVTTNHSIENDNDASSFDHNNVKTTTSNVNDGFTSDRQRLMSICGYYKLMTEARRVAPIDVKLKSGWWGASKSQIDAGKVKIAGLKLELTVICNVSMQEELLMKQKESAELQNLRSIEASKVKNGKIATSPTSTSSKTSLKFQSVIDTGSEINFSKLIDGHPSIYALQHKRLPCFQYIGYSDHVLQTMHDLLTLAFEAEVSGALVAALLTSISSDWRFHFLPLKCENEDESMDV
ncbi:hypothetical protein HELRODRAFT_170864 [Helobdella robusta]|uniref:Uncharacterized protein n=1 Tax=Helobdella robusta TaxID=6412 RepID=T1F3J0_HELRO|nr:hypothetical protein HELRODRAFT_170864 [Helobdella robusta]ESO06842.1 hypothetical protein HELRODRAFT_170864 [Helobdella robusta]